MPSIVLRLQFSENAVMSQKLITEIRSAVISVEELNLQGKDQSVFINVVYSHSDSVFPAGSFEAEITLKKKPERTKKVLDQLAMKVYDTISCVLNKYYHGFLGRVRTKTFSEEEEGYISSKNV